MRHWPMARYDGPVEKGIHQTWSVLSRLMVIMSSNDFDETDVGPFSVERVTPTSLSLLTQWPRGVCANDGQRSRSGLTAYATRRRCRRPHNVSFYLSPSTLFGTCCFTFIVETMRKWSSKKTTFSMLVAHCFRHSEQRASDGGRFRSNSNNSGKFSVVDYKRTVSTGHYPKI